MPRTDAPAPPDSTSPQGAERADPARKAGRAMAYSLKCLLDRVRGAREALPYLASLERGLSAEGAAVLDSIPAPGLQRMGAQLASLPVKAQDLPLRALQVQLLAAIERRAAPRRPALPVATPSDFAPTAPWNGHSTFVGMGRLEVSEVNASQFDAATDVMPGPG